MTRSFEHLAARCEDGMQTMWAIFAVTLLVFLAFFFALAWLGALHSCLVFKEFHRFCFNLTTYGTFCFFVSFDGCYYVTLSKKEGLVSFSTFGVKRQGFCFISWVIFGAILGFSFPGPGRWFFQIQASGRQI